jgi:DNA-binding NtrC family response regulator
VVDRILVVDDEPVVLDILSDVLSREGFDVRLAPRADAALEQLEQAGFDLVLSDIRMPGMDGFELLRRISRSHPGTDVILMTGYASVDGAIDAMQLGAADYLIKPLKPKEVVARIRSCLRRRELEAQVHEMRGEVRSRYDPQRIVSSSPAMKPLVQALGRLSLGEEPVVLCGEVGSGRRFLARALHFASQRRDGPLGEVDCELVAETQVADLLFGRTPAQGRRKPGQLERLAGGSLIVSEVDRLPAPVQTRLGRCLREGAWPSEGETEPRPLQTRLLLTCTSDPAELVEGERLAPELSVLAGLARLEVPPLRERSEDLAGLVDAFLEELAVEHGKLLRIAGDGIDLLRGQEFPGNVRQMRLALGHAATLSQDGQITGEVLQRALQHATDETHRGQRIADHLDEREYQLVLRAVQNHPRRLDEAARELGVSRTTLWRRMRKYGIRVSPPRGGSSD